jgi:hypothetical protein
MIRSEHDDDRSDVPTSVAVDPGSYLLESLSIPHFHPLHWRQKSPKLWHSSQFEEPQSRDQPEPQASFTSRVQLQQLRQGRAKCGPISTVKTRLRSLETSTDNFFLADTFGREELFFRWCEGDNTTTWRFVCLIGRVANHHCTNFSVSSSLNFNNL